MLDPIARVELYTRRELTQCSHWRDAFATERKDHRYYEVVEDTIEGFDYHYFVVRDAGGTVRAVMEVAGISSVLTKSIGTSNPHNVIKATFDALLRLKDVAKVAEFRSKTVEELGR